MGPANRRKAGSTIVVAGDVTLDWFLAPTAALDPETEEGRPVPNWQLYPGYRACPCEGGALLVARFVSMATGLCEIGRHSAPRIERSTPEEIVHSLAVANRFPRRAGEKETCFRVQEFRGFWGPSEGRPENLPIEGDDPDAEVVVLDDAGNGYRDDETGWPKAIVRGQPIVLYKLSRPLSKGRLLDFLLAKHADRLVTVVDANDLRHEGVNIGRGLSWERTALDFARRVRGHTTLEALAASAHLVVRLGMEAALHLERKAGGYACHLFYDPALIEGDVEADVPGKVIGGNSLFCAVVAERLLNGGFRSVGEGIRNGLLGALRLFLAGLGNDPAAIGYPGAEILGFGREGDPHIASVRIPAEVCQDPERTRNWRILEELSGPVARQRSQAFEMVTKKDQAGLAGVPVGEFGDLKTIDRCEIENYRAVSNLLREYIRRSPGKGPLSIAVFGPPGSGKSFGVEQVARSVAPGRIAKLTFNLSEYRQPEELARAFHVVRDVALGGKIPLVFFDEFDCGFGGELGWLKYFLAPMQDGKFREGETIHPIGKSIFVFAGGTKPTFAEFAREDLSVKGGRDAEADAEWAEFRNAKGPDFVSRLRGYVDILGPNPVDETDKLYIVRRAMLLRIFLKSSAPQILDSKGEIAIDPGVLNAFVGVRKYKHGVRSLQAVVEMSMLSGRRSFERAALPPPAQLRLHVTEDFMSLVAGDTHFALAREAIAREIHRRYLQRNPPANKPDDPARRDWSELTDDFRNANYRQADDIPAKLARLNLALEAGAAGGALENAEIPEDKVEELARLEHERWVVERRLAGWAPGAKKDEANKLSPYLVDWEDLDSVTADTGRDIKDEDRQPVRDIPGIAAAAGFRIVHGK